MKRVLKLIENFCSAWLFPPKLNAIAYYFLWRLDGFLVFRARNNLYAFLKKQKKKEEALIIANGPSLAKFNLKLSREMDIFGINALFKHRDFAQTNIQALFIAETLSPESTDKFREIIKRTVESICRETRRYSNCPIVVHEDFMNIPFIRNTKNTVPFISNYIHLNFIPNKLKSWEAKLIPRFKNTTQFAIYAAILQDYKRIYILGLDENQLVHIKGQRNEHFYSETAEEISDYTLNISYAERCLGKHLTLKGYEKLAVIAEQKNIKIINLNTESYVDCFDFDPEMSAKFYIGDH